MKIIKLLQEINKDERGAESLEKLLLICAVVLPLLAVLIFYRNDIGNWLKAKWEEVRGQGVVDPNTSTPF